MRRSSGVEFPEQLDPVGAEVHIHMGDIFDKPFVPDSIVWRRRSSTSKPSNTLNYVHHPAWESRR